MYRTIWYFFSRCSSCASFAWETKNFRFYGNIDTARKPPKINKKKCKSFTRRVLRLCSCTREFKNHQLKQRIGLSTDLQIKWCILTWQCHPSNSCWPFGCFHFFFNNVSLYLQWNSKRREGSSRQQQKLLLLLQAAQISKSHHFATVFQFVIHAHTDGLVL